MKTLTKSEKVGYGLSAFLVAFVIFLLLRKFGLASERKTMTPVDVAGYPWPSFPGMPPWTFPDFPPFQFQFGAQPGYSPASCACGCEDLRLGYDNTIIDGLEKTMNEALRTKAGELSDQFVKSITDNNYLHYLNTQQVAPFIGSPDDTGLAFDVAGAILGTVLPPKSNGVI